MKYVIIILLVWLWGMCVWNQSKCGMRGERNETKNHWQEEEALWVDCWIFIFM